MKRSQAEVHRSVGRAEHGIEEALDEQAENLPDPDRVRRRATALSRRADRHLQQADRIEGEGAADA